MAAARRMALEVSLKIRDIVFFSLLAKLPKGKAYGMSKSGIWKPAAQAGITYILTLQSPTGGWRHGNGLDQCHHTPGQFDRERAQWTPGPLRYAG